MTQQPFPATLAGALAAAGFLVLVSACWVETDAYRGAAIVFFFWGLYEYLRYPRLLHHGYFGHACFVWIAYVAIRYLWVAWSGTTRPLGVSEGIYLLAAFYTTTGFMMFRYRHVAVPTIVLFLAISLAAILASTDLVAAFDLRQHPFLWMNNLIHAAVAGGFILLAALAFLAFVVTRWQPGWRRTALVLLSVATAAAAAIALYGAKSKGVWAALVVAAAVQLVLSRRRLARPRVLAALAMGAAAGAILLWFAWPTVWITIRPTYNGLSALLADLMHTGDPMATMAAMIDGRAMPRSLNLRLMLWYGALEVWSRDVLFGVGIGWRDLLVASRYGNTGYDALHNGYLELAMRYGLLGLAFYAALFGWTVFVARRAAQAGLVPREAYAFHVVALVFFLVTILTNSNNRLAIGESYMIAAAGFGFCCHFLLRDREKRLAG